jgi:hypothetical protein
MARNKFPTATLAWGALATLYAATAVLSMSDRSAAEDSLNGMLDLPAKHYAAEVLLGASDGMKVNGWSNFSIEERLGAVKAATHEPLRRHMTAVYEKAYSQGVNGEWDEAALDGYLEVVEMPKSDIFRLNQSTLEGDEKINPGALNAKIEADYGARWDDVGKHFREGLEGIIHTTVASVEIAFANEPDSQTRTIGEMQPPVYSAAEEYGFMTSGPNEPNATVAYSQTGVIDAQNTVERLTVKTTERDAVELVRPKIALYPKPQKIAVVLEPLNLDVEDPFTAGLVAEQDLSNDNPDQPN